jgi:hypothetical protein
MRWRKKKAVEHLASVWGGVGGRGNENNFDGCVPAVLKGGICTMKIRIHGNKTRNNGAELLLKI